MSGAIPAAHLDSNVLSFLHTNTGVTSSTQIRALNNFVKSLKFTGIWGAFLPNNFFFASTPTSGTYTLTYGGYTTSSLNYNAAATGAGSVQTALRAITGLGSVVVTGTYNSATGFYIKMIGVDTPLVLGVGSNTTGIGITTQLLPGFIYPFVGGTSTTCSYNLVDPTKHQITWHGSPTFTANGVTGNGTTAYGSQDLLDNFAGDNLCNISAYNRTNSGAAGTYAIGAFTTGNYSEIVPAGDAGLGGTSSANFASTPISGFLMGNRDTTTSLYSIYNGVRVNHTVTSVTTSAVKAFAILALQSGSPVFYGAFNLALVSYGTALSITGTEGVQEVQTITTVADSGGSLNSKYFTLDTPMENYYIWYSISGAGVDPAIPHRVGIMVTAATGASANTIASNTNTALNTAIAPHKAQVTCTVATNVVTCTNNSIGAVNAAANGTASPGFTFAVTTAGVTPTSQTGLFASIVQKFQYQLGRDAY